jgi:eukaryotic-like serine/threonine-protein kinase
MRDKAEAHIQTALALAPDDPRVLANVAAAYEVLGETPAALRNIEKALAKGFPLDDLKADPILHKFTDDPNFRPPKKTPS